MTCEIENKEETACKNCTLKKIINVDNWGSPSMSKSSVISNGEKINIKPKDAWVGLPKREVIICDRGIEIPVE